MSVAQEQWSRWHPIARSVAQRMIARDDPDLTDDELTELAQSLAALRDTQELRNAVRDVLYLAAALEHEGATRIAQRLFALVEAKPLLGALDRVNHMRAVDRAEAVASRAKRFAEFSRSDRTARPAANDAGAPRGLRVRDLKLIPVIA